MALISLSSHHHIYIYIYILYMLRISEYGQRVRTCGPDKSSENDRKSQINIGGHQIFCPELPMMSMYVFMVRTSH